MTTFFIIPADIYATTNWRASHYCNVGPVPIYSGQYAGSYAVNTAILDTDSCFNKYKKLFESCVQAELSSELTNPETM